VIATTTVDLTMSDFLPDLIPTCLHSGGALRADGLSTT
jgi:hypothetical protein